MSCKLLRFPTQSFGRLPTLPRQQFCLPDQKLWPRVARSIRRTAQIVRMGATGATVFPETTVPAPGAAVDLEAADTRRLLPVTVAGGRVATGDLAILAGLSANVAESAQVRSQVGVVLAVCAAGGNPTSLEDATVGSLYCKRSTPEWGTCARDLPPETQFLLLQLADSGPYAVILPLLDSGKFRGTLRPPGRKEGSDMLRIRIESGTEDVAAAQWDCALLVAAGSDPYALVDAAVAEAARLSGTAKPRAAKQLPEFVDVFGWCTWDAFYSRVSAEGINEGLTALREGGTPPRFLIIDDGWQCTDVDPSLRPALTPDDIPRLEAEMQVLLRGAKAGAVGAGGGGALSYLANEASYDENEVETAREHIATLTANVKGKPSGPLARRWAAAKGYAIGIFEIVLALIYKFFIEHAPADSWRIRWFGDLAKGPLRERLLRYYAETADQVKRLLRVTANGKFSAPHAGPEVPVMRPEALSTVVAHIRYARYQEEFAMQHIFCWHSLYGYWAGVSPDTPELAHLSPRIVMPRPSPGVVEIDPTYAWSMQVLSGVGVVDDIGRLYSDMHTYLADAGINGVKVDCQSTVDMIGAAPSMGGGAALSATYHRALEASVALHFPGNNCINCMCHSTNDLYRMADTALVRSSDDFWPRDTASHTTHIAVNAGNSMFLGALLQPDWDMFHSKHPAALLHATARVVSGGPLYVSDHPGEHDFALLRRLVLPDGIILRCCGGAGRPTLDCIFADVMRDNATLLKVWNTNAHGAVVAVFNTQGASWDRSRREFREHSAPKAPLRTLVAPNDVPAFACTKGARFVAWIDSVQTACVLTANDSLHVVLDCSQSDIITLLPIKDAGGIAVAPIGLVNMLNASGALQHFEVGVGGPVDVRASVQVRLRGCGEFAMYCTEAPLRLSLNHEATEFKYSSARNLLSFEVPHIKGLVSEIVVTF